MNNSLEIMRVLIEEFYQDKVGLNRSYNIPLSSLKKQKTEKYFKKWLAKVKAINFDDLDQNGKVDYLLLKNTIEYELQLLGIESLQHAELEPILPFAQKLVGLMEKCRLMESLNAAEAAQVLVDVNLEIKALNANLSDLTKTVKITVVSRAQQNMDKLKAGMQRWYDFYFGFDPDFNWWCDQPYKVLVESLDEFNKTLKKVLDPEDAGINAPVIGDSIGRDALINELDCAMIPYTPEELLEIGKKELAWCHDELKKAAAELGYDNWRDALEHVKRLHVEPGGQPKMIKDLADEAIAYVEEHDLVTVPEIAKDLWRMEMMTAEEQKVSPFFLGGEVIKVSFPTAAMSDSEKQMSMRGNNSHFARAVAQHELIPGHHLQLYSISRFKAYRKLFITPFWVEGWALHWEMLLWEMNFQKSAENKMGMLFWRSHRAARIVFSLSFHLELMTPQECIDMLVDDVGHERDNAIAEVRRSFIGWYPPLYQAAYMLGGLQIHEMYKEQVGTGKLSSKEFHDRIMQENSMPIEMLRALFNDVPLTKEYKANWRFY